ncbi:calcium-binding protein [Mesorhizobium sp. CU2]|uniref:calcium-binding protein n=1 Tax=unclassified Mesorhizobium TaxID=325217 RepID=UPI00112C438C|nr:MULTISPECIES: calcium-binding protein [unclassified Mesorhizobium]TPN74534.1 calcium-binding protein [Mesorhizobium sp. CU3]TPO06713.1 calcium-binding protein [Mesorhizobium sp. CU2]
MYRRTLFCLAAIIAVTGCAADYLNNYDTMTLASGDANNTNRMLQTVDAFNPNSNNTHIEGDGQRSAGVVQRYRGVQPPAAALGQVPNSNVDLDCAGGKGDNPVVQGPVAVGPSDPNGLDRNHNGIGCER